MSKKLLATGICALGLSLALPLNASAQEMSSLYVAPKIFYSHQMGDLNSSKWVSGPWQASVLGGDQSDNNFGLGLALGMDLGYYYDLPVRLELEYAYRSKAKFGEGPSAVYSDGLTYTASHNFEVKAHSVMVNAFYDFNNQSVFTPYIGGGLGLAYLSTDYHSRISNGLSGAINTSNNDWNFAWNVGGGVTYHFSDSMALDLGYRYVDLGSAGSGSSSVNNYVGSSSLDYTAHEIGLALRFSGF